jgi:cation diffusion facilitator family transporter
VTGGGVSEQGHGHGQGHAHGHGVSADADRRWLSVALGLIVVFMVGEFVVGLLAGSLALISDSAHMLTDAASLVLALVAIRLSARPAQGSYTYGLKRAEILSAQANGITLLLLSVWFVYEGVRRLLDPPPVAGGLVLITAVVGIVVNVAAAWCISRANRTSLNVEGAFQHILNDLYAFIATAIAGAVVLLTGFARADALAALLVAALMLKAGWGLVRESGRIFLEAAPRGVGGCGHRNSVSTGSRAARNSRQTTTPSCRRCPRGRPQVRRTHHWPGCSPPAPRRCCIWSSRSFSSRPTRRPRPRSSARCSSSGSLVSNRNWG